MQKIRKGLGLSQEAFAETYGFAVSVVRDWEQGRRRPKRSARILLKIVEKEPEAVTRALAGYGSDAELAAHADFRKHLYAYDVVPETKAAAAGLV